MIGHRTGRAASPADRPASPPRQVTAPLPEARPRGPGQASRDRARPTGSPRPRRPSFEPLQLRALLLAALLPAGSAAADHRLTGRDIAAGATLYAEHCAACHGADLEGQPDWRSPGEGGLLAAPPHDARGHTWHHETPLLLDYTLKGGRAALAARGVKGFESGMPAFADILSEDQALDILAFIRSTWPKRLQEAQSAHTHATD